MNQSALIRLQRATAMALIKVAHRLLNNGASGRYEHLFLLGYSVDSNDAKGRDLTAAEHERAVIRRARDISQRDDWQEAVGEPEDTDERE